MVLAELKQQALKQAASGILLRQYRTILAYVNQYWHMLNNLVQLNNTEIYWQMLNNFVQLGTILYNAYNKLQSVQYVQ